MFGYFDEAPACYTYCIAPKPAILYFALSAVSVTSLLQLLKLPGHNFLHGHLLNFAFQPGDDI